MIKLKLKTLAPLALLLAAVPAAALQPLPLLDDEATEAEEEDEHWVLLKGGDVYTGTGALLRKADVLCRDGKIAEIGYDLYAPEEAEVMEISGYRVYPGLVALESRGLFGGSGSLADSVDPFNESMTYAVASGITTAVNGSEIGKLNRGRLEDVLVKRGTFVGLSYSISNPSGRGSLREKLEAAAAYLRTYREWQVQVRSNKDLKEPKKSGVDSNVLAVLEGKARALFSSDEQQDLVGIARLAQEYGFRPVIKGCREGWIVADELGRAGAFAIIEARDRRSKNEALVRPGGSSIENAAILHQHGVQVAVLPSSTGISLGGIVGRDIMHMPTEAAFAVRGGLPEDAAIASMTTIPARLLGLGHRLGTIEEGKDADLIVTDGDLLHYRTFVQWALVGGRVVYDKEAELYFAHIRPRPDGELAPESPVDPGEDDVVEPPAEEPEEEPAEEPSEGSGDAPTEDPTEPPPADGGTEEGPAEDTAD